MFTHMKLLLLGELASVVGILFFFNLNVEMLKKINNNSNNKSNTLLIITLTVHDKNILMWALCPLKFIVYDRSIRLPA